MGFGGLAQRGDLGGGVDAAGLCRLRDRDRLRPHPVDIAADRGQQGVDGLRRVFGVVAANGHQLGAVGIEGGGAALVVFDMGILVADDAPVWLDHSRQRQTIGRRTARRPEGRTGAAEHRAEGLVQRLAQRVVVIGRLRAIGGAHCVPYGGVDGGGVIRQELHRAGMGAQPGGVNPRPIRRCDTRDTISRNWARRRRCWWWADIPDRR